MIAPDERAAVLNTLQAAARLRRLAVTLLVVTALASGGCSLLETGVPLGDTHAESSLPPPQSDALKSDSLAANSVPNTSDDAAPPMPPAPSAADVMFQSADLPVAPPKSNVNVFGEVGGVAPSPFVNGSANGLQQHTYVDEGYDADPTISPDGKWILFSSTRNSEHPDIYVQRIGGVAVTQLTSDGADDAFPRYSRDGRQIVFASNRTGNWDLYLMDADGKRVRPLTHSPAQEIHPSFAPDGNRIVFSSLGSRSGQWELWTLDLRSNERKMIGYGLFPDWSPRTDRDVIAFQRARQRGTRWFSAWTLDLVDGEAKDITEVAYSSTNAIVAPAWNGDGTRLAFCTIADPESGAATKNAKRVKPPQQDVWTINADGSDRMRVTDGRGVNAMPAWANDGRLFFVSDRAGAESIFSANTPAPNAFEPASAKGNSIEPAVAKSNDPPAEQSDAKVDPASTPKSEDNHASAGGE